MTAVVGAVDLEESALDEAGIGEPVTDDLGRPADAETLVGLLRQGIVILHHALLAWEKWHVWDHLVQDFDPARDNYGVIAEHPERLDIHAARNASASRARHIPNAASIVSRSSSAVGIRFSATCSPSRAKQNAVATGPRCVCRTR